MKSFGILYKNKENKENVKKIDLHINLWDLSFEKSKKGEPCIDFGLKIDQFKDISRIQFYFPFLVKKEGVIDLYGHMKERDIASLIFNDNNFELTQDKDGVTYNISGEKEKRLLLKIEDNISINAGEDNKYSILEINMDKIQSRNRTQNNVYFRFRIKSPELKKMLWLQSKLDNHYFESAFISKQIIDIKVNEPRNIDDKYKDACKSEGYQYFQLNKVHFLLAEPASGTSTFFGEANVSCRTLEHRGWHEYLDETYNTKNALVYHVKSKNNNEHLETEFSCLVKSEIKDTNWKLILTYILGVIVLGAGGSGLLEIIKCLFGVKCF